MPQKLQVFLIMKNFYFDLYDISEDIKERLILIYNFRRYKREVEGM